MSDEQYEFMCLMRAFMDTYEVLIEDSRELRTRSCTEGVDDEELTSWIGGLHAVYSGMEALYGDLVGKFGVFL